MFRLLGVKKNEFKKAKMGTPSGSQTAFGCQSALMSH